MRGEITLKILKCVKSASGKTVDAAAAFLAAGYGASAKKLDYELSKRREARTEQEERQKFYKLLYKLEKDGLIEKTKRKKPIILHLTLKGKKFLQLLSEKKSVALPDISYETSNADKLIIVVFDIPESEKKKTRMAAFRIEKYEISLHSKKRLDWKSENSGGIFIGPEKVKPN